MYVDVSPKVDVIFYVPIFAPYQILKIISFVLKNFKLTFNDFIDKTHVNVLVLFIVDILFTPNFISKTKY